MDLEFDSEEFLLQAFDEGFEETETSQEESQSQTIKPKFLEINAASNIHNLD